MTLKFNVGPKKPKLENIGNGQYPARVVQIIDFGTQEVEGMSGEVKEQPRLWMVFELPTKRIEIEGEGSRPRWLGKEYTVSDYELSNLYKAIVNIMPLFDFEEDSLESLLGMKCMIQVGTTSGDKDKITGVNLSIEGLEVGELENPTKYFDLGDPDYDAFRGLPKWMQKKILSSLDLSESPLEKLLAVNNFSLEK